MPLSEINWFLAALMNCKCTHCSRPTKDFNLLPVMLSTTNDFAGSPNGILTRVLSAKFICFVANGTCEVISIYDLSFCERSSSVTDWTEMSDSD